MVLGRFTKLCIKFLSHITAWLQQPPNMHTHTLMSQQSLVQPKTKASPT